MMYPGTHGYLSKPDIEPDEDGERVTFLVRGHVEGRGKITHMIRAANSDMARGKFRRAYNRKTVRIIDCKKPHEVMEELEALNKKRREKREAKAA